jgi:hypothetical protein
MEFGRVQCWIFSWGENLDRLQTSLRGRRLNLLTKKTKWRENICVEQEREGTKETKTIWKREGKMFTRHNVSKEIRDKSS